MRFRRGHGGAYGGFIGDIARKTEAAEFRSGRGRGCAVEIDDSDPRGAAAHEFATDRAANTPAGAGDECNLAFDFHGAKTSARSGGAISDAS